MRSYWTAVSCSVVGIVSFLYAAQNTAKKDELVHVVRKGESLSLICIDYYGHYSKDMGSAVKQINNTIKNVNLIYAGQKIKLRNPSAPPPKPKTPQAVLTRKVNATQGIVTCVKGTAYVIAKKGGSKKKLAVNTVVFPGNVIRTGSNGRVELIINRESVVRMRENSRLVVSAMRNNADKKGTTSVEFSIGTIWAKVKAFGDKVSRFQMELPTAVAGVHGTVYQGTVAKDSSADVKVYDGEVAVKGQSSQAPQLSQGLSEAGGPQEVAGPHEVTMEEWVHIVRSMQQIHINKKGAASKPSSFEKVADGWEKWNEERDKRIAEMFSREF